MANIVGLALITVCAFSAFVPNVEAARILAYFPSLSKSHMLIHCSIAETLAKAGHDVTVIGGSSNVFKNAKYKFIQIGQQMFDTGFLNEMVNRPKPVYRLFGPLIKIVTASANDSLSDPKMQQFLRENDESSFDLLLMGYFYNDLHLGLAGHFKCPVIISFMIRSIFAVNDMVGNPYESSYVPALYTGMKQPMDFWNRVKNFLAIMYERHFVTPYLEYFTQKYYKYHFPSNRYPSLEEVRKNISLVFVNHHFSQGPIRPDVPGIVEVGGIQIKEKPDPLPTDIAQILDNAKEGVIYFSLGSNVQGTNLREDKAKIMFDVLSKLPYTVLWKWGDSDFPGTSPNIIYKSWLPQDDILAHPNVKLFITHGGQGSVVESQYHGVPMVGIPLFGDQPSNIASVEKSGFGKAVGYMSMTAETFREAVVEVMENPRYAKAVKKFSQLYRDRPMTPRQLVNYWVDYVLRHNGAKHMQSPAVYMNKWQLMSLDVIGFLLAIVAIAVAVLVKTFKLLCYRGDNAKREGSKRGEKKPKTN